MAKAASRREVIGLVFRGLRKELDRRGLTERVQQHLQGAARDALQSPPLHRSWLPAAPHDEIILALAKETNRQTVRDVSYGVVKGTTGPLALPLIKMILTLSGATPLTLLSNLNRIVTLHMRGIEFAYAAETASSGVVTVTYADVVDPAHFTTWEGVLTFARDILGIGLLIDQAVPQPDGHSAQIHVSWGRTAPGAP